MALQPAAAWLQTGTKGAGIRFE